MKDLESLRQWLASEWEAKLVSIAVLLSPFLLLGSSVALYAYGWMSDLPRSMTFLLGAELFGVFAVHIAILTAALTLSLRVVNFVIPAIFVVALKENRESISKDTPKRLLLLLSQIAASLLIAVLIGSAFIGWSLALSLLFATIFSTIALGALILLAEAAASSRKEYGDYNSFRGSLLSLSFMSRPYLSGHPLRQLALILLIALSFQQLGRHQFLSSMEQEDATISLQQGTPVSGKILAQISSGVYVTDGEKNVDGRFEVRFYPLHSIAEIFHP